MIETYFIIFVVFAFGAAIGSFLHVVAERNVQYSMINNQSRKNNKWSIVFGRSYCPNCKKNLTSQELIPIVSYVLQHARCRGCGKHIPMHYTVLELLSGFVCVALLAPAILAHQALVLPILYYIAACVLIILIHIDARSMMLPDRFIIIVGVIAFIIAVLSGKTGDDMAFGILAGAGLIYTIWLATAGQGIGFGDVKLMVPLGILFGLQGVITLLFISFFIGGFVGIVMLATKQATRKTAIPFGPFLAGVALLLLLFPNIPDRFFALIGV